MRFTLVFFLLLSTQTIAEDAGITLPPVYRPPADTHIIRIWGHPYLKPIVQRWQEHYQQLHPQVKFELHMTGSNVAMAGLYTGQADLALLGRPATESEIKAFEWVYQVKPAYLDILTGSYNTPGKAAALVALVNKSNPLNTITYRQIESLFNHKQKNTHQISLTHWGDFGLGGEWENQRINLYSIDTDRGTGRFFRQAVLKNSRKLNWEHLHEVIPNPKNQCPLQSANKKLHDLLANDRFGIAIAMLDHGIAPAIKTLAVAPCDNCPAVVPSTETVAKHQYPLARKVTAYYNQPKNQSADPVLTDFLNFILHEGQQLVKPSDGYLPLNRQ